MAKTNRSRRNEINRNRNVGKIRLKKRKYFSESTIKSKWPLHAEGRKTNSFARI